MRTPPSTEILRKAPIVAWLTSVSRGLANKKAKGRNKDSNKKTYAVGDAVDGSLDTSEFTSAFPGIGEMVGTQGPPQRVEGGWSDKSLETILAGGSLPQFPWL